MKKPRKLLADKKIKTSDFAIAGDNLLKNSTTKPQKTVSKTYILPIVQ